MPGNSSCSGVRLQWCRATVVSGMVSVGGRSPWRGPTCLPTVMGVCGSDPRRQLILRAAFHDDTDVAAAALDAFVGRFPDESAAVGWIHAGPAHRVLPALAARTPVVAGFDAVAEAAAAAAAQAWGFHERACDQIRPFVDAYNGEGIRLLALKGMGLLGSAYPDPATRYVGDADLYVTPHHAAAAARVADKLGWHGPEAGWHWYSPGLVTQALCGPRGGSIDLHHRPGRAFVHDPSRYTPMSATARPLPSVHPLADTALWAPDDDWQLLVVATHAAHPVNAHVVHVTADVHRVVTRTSVQPARVAALEAKCGVTLRVRAALTTAAELLDTPFDLGLLTPMSPHADAVERRAMRIEEAMAAPAARRNTTVARRMVRAVVHGSGGVRPWAAARVAAGYVGNGVRQRRHRSRPR